MAERWKAGRKCWASGRLTGELVMVDSMRWAATGFWTACLRRLGRMIEAIAQVVGRQWMAGRSCRGVKSSSRNLGDVVDNASDVEC